MKELTISDVEQVSGGISDDVIWGGAITVSGALLAGAIAVSSPILVVALAGGSLISSGIAMNISWMSGGGNVEFLPDFTRRRG